jgi:hypothetical protein
MNYPHFLTNLFRALLLLEVISIGIIIPKYHKVDEKLNHSYQNILSNLNALSVKNFDSLNDELRYDLLRAKRQQNIKLF